MQYQQFPPGKNLEDLVQFFWSFETTASAQAPFQHLAPASVNPKLAFLYHGAVSVHSAGAAITAGLTGGFQGQGQQAYQMTVYPQTGVFGVFFFPQAIPLLFSLPAEALTNQNVDIRTLLGLRGQELEEKMVSAPSNAARLDILSCFLVAQRAGAPCTDPKTTALIRHLLSGPEPVNMTALLTQQSLSQRQMERRFKHFTGFSPKMFSRIVRFEHSVARYLDGGVSLTEVAHAGGYHDQAHFIRDFREFAGHAPRAYFGQDLSPFKV